MKTPEPDDRVEAMLHLEAYAMETVALLERSLMGSPRPAIPQSPSDSLHLAARLHVEWMLNGLALEYALKGLCTCDGDKRVPNTHDFHELYALLPASTKKELQAEFSAHMTGSFEELLGDWSAVFQNDRYGYEPSSSGGPRRNSVPLFKSIMAVLLERTSPYKR